MRKHTIGLGLTGLIAATCDSILLANNLKYGWYNFDMDGFSMSAGLFFGLIIGIYVLVFKLVNGSWYTKLVRVLLWVIASTLIHAGVVFGSGVFIFFIGQFAPIIIGGVFGALLMLFAFLLIYPLPLKANWLWLLGLSVILSMSILSTNSPNIESSTKQGMWMVLIWQTGMATAIGSIIDKRTKEKLPVKPILN